MTPAPAPPPPNIDAAAAGGTLKKLSGGDGGSGSQPVCESPSSGPYPTFSGTYR